VACLNTTAELQHNDALKQIVFLTPISAALCPFSGLSIDFHVTEFQVVDPIDPEKA
jgi:hypothetical protein